MLDTKKNKKPRVTFLAYREWALESIQNISDLCIEIVDIIHTEEEYTQIVLKYPDNFVDCIVLIGWSWIISENILNKFLCVGIHPSDLPNFRGGSPIQHQIIQGIEKTKISLMSISPIGIDVGDIWLKEDLDLTGTTMHDVFKSLSISTTKILISFFKEFYTIKPTKQDISKGSYYKRRKPSESKTTWQQLSKMNLKDVYNLIRALEDPYPNLYVEDINGNKLFFKEVAYIDSKDAQEKL